MFLFIKILSQISFIKLIYYAKRLIECAANSKYALTSIWPFFLFLESLIICEKQTLELKFG